MGIRAKTYYSLCLYTDSTKGPKNETKCEKYETTMSHSTQYGVLKTNVKNNILFSFLEWHSDEQMNLASTLDSVFITVWSSKQSAPAHYPDT